MQVKKAVITAAGMGLDFLPATKAQPKEMLPVVDKPVIQFVVEEAVEAGITDILIIIGKGKRAIEDHFDRSFELEYELKKKGNVETLHSINRLSALADIHFIRQKDLSGLGGAIMYAKMHCGNEPFVLMLGDTIIRSKSNFTKELIELYSKENCPVVGVCNVKDSEVTKYGIVDPDKLDNDKPTPENSIKGSVFKIINLIEKPAHDEAPSNMAIAGRYVLTPEIFSILAETPKDRFGQLQLTDALKTVAENRLLAKLLDGNRYDIGSRVDYLKAIFDFALSRPDVSSELKAYIKSIM